MPLSPPTALGGYALITSHHLKQETHGTQSMGLKTIINPNQKIVLIPCFSVSFRGKYVFCFCLFVFLPLCGLSVFAVKMLCFF